MRKEINKHLRARYPVLLHQVKEEGETFYVAEFPDLPGCMSHGKSANEALKNADGAKRLWIRSRLEDRLPIPEPTEVLDFSGKYLLRLPKSLHRELAQQATQNGVSLNQYTVARLGEAKAVDQIRTELQREFSQLKGQIEALSRENQRLCGLVTQFAYYRRVIEEGVVVQSALGAQDQQSVDTTTPSHRTEGGFVTTAGPHPSSPLGELGR